MNGARCRCVTVPGPLAQAMGRRHPIADGEMMGGGLRHIVRIVRQAR